MRQGNYQECVRGERGGGGGVFLGDVCGGGGWWWGVFGRRMLGTGFCLYFY